MASRRPHTRRSFVASAGALGAGLALGACGAAARRPLKRGRWRGRLVDHDDGLCLVSGLDCQHAIDRGFGFRWNGSWFRQRMRDGRVDRGGALRVQAPGEATRLCETAPGVELTLDYSHFVYQGYAEAEIVGVIDEDSAGESLRALSGLPLPKEIPIVASFADAIALGATAAMNAHNRK